MRGHQSKTSPERRCSRKWVEHLSDQFFSSLGAWEWDFGSRIVQLSDGLVRLLGAPRDGKRASPDLILSLVHSEDHATVADALERATRETNAIDLEFRVRAGAAGWRWIACKGEVFVDPHGAPAWAAGVMFDITQIRSTQVELARREHRYRVLASAKSFGEWHADANGKIEENAFWADFTGCSIAGDAECAWLASVHPEDRSHLASLWTEMLRLGCGSEMKFRLAHRSGGYRWVLVKSVPLRSGDGSVVEWVGTIEDYQSKWEIEEQLRVRGERLQLALVAARMYAWDYELETGLIKRSDNAVEILGIDGDAISEVQALLHPNDLENVRRALAETAAGKALFDCEYRLRGRDDRELTFRSRGKLIRNSLARPERIIGISIDVTSEQATCERHRAMERAMILLEARLDAMKRVAGDIVWTADPDGKVDDVPQWREVTGQTKKEISGWGWLNAIHPEDRERVRQGVLAQIETATPQALSYRLRTRTGGYRLYDVRSAPVIAGNCVSEWVGRCSERLGTDADFGDTTGLNKPRDQDRTSGAQVRAARAILRWSVRELAEKSGVSVSTIRRMEEEDGNPHCRDERVVRLVRATFEEAGIVFGAIAGRNDGVAPGR